MGISRDSIHKRRLTGSKRVPIRKKRKYDLGRQAANTRIGTKLVRPLRVRGGNFKHRALRLDSGNYAWPSEATTRKTRVLSVVYNATSNELVRTNTLVKSAIVQIDAAPFRAWYQQHYGIDLGKKLRGSGGSGGSGGGGGDEEAGGVEGEQQQKQPAAADKNDDGVKRSRSLQAKVAARQSKRLPLDRAMEEQFQSGRMLACISSRPGQCGRADGYILEGKELEFYAKKLQKKKSK